MGTFQELNLSAGMLEAIAAAGYEMPTAVQSRAIPVLLTGRDLVAQARTGTGKTAAFGIPMLEALDAGEKHAQSLVLCPTRELAVQTASALYTLGSWRGIRVIPVYGGQPIERQLKALRGGSQVIVATPGRLLDHLRRSTLDVSHVTKVVLDEADEMLAMGFIEDIEQILQALPGSRQTALFSATMPAPIARLSQKFLKDPERLIVEMEAHKAPMIRQSYYEVVPFRKVEALERILDMETPGPTIIFCRTRKEASEISERLRGRGCLAEGLHGDLSQQDRDRVLARFRDGTVEMLVATDVAARGLDIENVTHVINLDVPWDSESYTHRIGRTGRAGKAGDAITLIYPRERRQLREIEKHCGVKMSPMVIPTAGQIRERRLEALEASVREQLEDSVGDSFTAMAPRLLEGQEAPKVVGALLSMLWDSRHTDREPSEMELDASAPPEQGMTRLTVNVGRRLGVRPGDLVGAIANECGLPGKSIGSIDILEHASFFEIPRDRVDQVREALQRTKIRGVRVRVDLAGEDAPRRGPPRFKPQGAHRVHFPGARPSAPARHAPARPAHAERPAHPGKPHKKWVKSEAPPWTEDKKKAKREKLRELKKLRKQKKTHAE